MLRTGITAVLAAAVMIATGCIPPEPDNDRIVQFDPEEATMGVVQEAGELVVGVERDLPPLSSGSSEEDGLVDRMAEEVAAALGVDVRYVTGTTEQLLAMPEAGEADITFPFAPITEKLVRRHAMSDPYLVAHQRVLVPSHTNIETFRELSGAEICSAMDPETGSDLTVLVDGVTVRTSHVRGCYRMLVQREVEAITAPDVLLVPLVTRALPGPVPRSEIVSDELNTEAYGAVVERGDSTWVGFVSAVLEEAQAEGRWSEWFDELIAPGLPGVPSDPPGLTLEEGAALYPRDQQLD
jgi:polar amino acid transport system substrate-binding protein